jgi:HPt (histidine-containing phosphotransfer) domain-containing protein
MNSEHSALEQYVDMTELLHRVEGDRELLIELLTLFQEDFPRLRDALHAAVDSKDQIQVEKTAHTLKGMLANLSVKQASRLAANVEIAARTGDAQRILEAVAELDRDEQGLVEAVESFIAGVEP